MMRRLAMLGLAATGLAGCVAYQDPVAYAPQPVYVAPPPPVYVAPAPPPRRYYARPYHPRRAWVPRRCDAWGRCWGGYWR
jgi:hypothetical protein